MIPRRSHVWHTRAGRTECKWCSMRLGWDGASSPCSGAVPELVRNPEHRRLASKQRSRLLRQQQREAKFFGGGS